MLTADSFVPRRYDVGAPDFDPAVGQRLTILLDGQEQPLVIAYDCDEGWAERYVVDGKGNIQLDRERQQAKTECVYGDVVVRWK